MDATIVMEGTRVYFGTYIGNDVYADICKADGKITINFVVDHWRGEKQVVFSTSNKEKAAKYILATF